MRKTILTLLLACVAAPVWAGLCQDCPDDPGQPGGGGGAPQAMNKVVLHRIDAFEHTIELTMNNGSTIVIDDDLNKMFLSSVNHDAVLNLNTVLLQWANGNQTAANAMRAEIHQFATTPGFKTQLAKQTATQGLIMGPGGGYPPFNCNGGYTCYYVPDQIEGWGSYGFGFTVGAPGVGGGVGSPDWQDWNHHRSDACESADENFIDAVESVGIMIVGCPFFETGVGAAACGVGGIGVVKNMNRAAKNSKTCHAPYPGAGNW